MSTAIRKATFVLFLIPLVSAVPARSQHAYDYDSTYIFLNFYEYHKADSTEIHSTIGFSFGQPINKSRVVYEWQRPLVTFQTHNSNDDFRVTSTWLVMGCNLAIVAWPMAALGFEEEKIDKMMMYALAPYGSHIGYRITKSLSVYTGIMPDVILFSDDDGILAQFRIGGRIDSNFGLVINAGYTKTIFWGFEQSSRTYSGNVSLGISYSSPIGSMLFD